MEAYLADHEHIVSEIQKTDRERVRVTLGEYNARSVVGIRIWYCGTDGSWRPSRAGITTRIDLLPSLTDALVEAQAEARRQGLLPGE
jgi:hypothetical protein